MDNNMNDLSFDDVKNLYIKLRKAERNKIQKYLQEEVTAFKITKTRAFQGRGKLKNWFGIDVIINNKYAFFLSLQPFNIDNHKYCNYHVVMDNIGIYKYPQAIADNYIKNNFNLETPCALALMDDTGISLPMNNKKLKELVEELKKRI